MGRLLEENGPGFTEYSVGVVCVSHEVRNLSRSARPISGFSGLWLVAGAGRGMVSEDAAAF
jgi:hypothetical protein